ncbi:MAG: tryptophan synthase subunit alpha [Thiotrichaceae bacterium]
MSRIANCFETLKKQNTTALIPYIAAGDPDLSVTVPLMHHMVANGANILELGVPFSDPSADGPIIQKSMERALAQGISLLKVLDRVKEFRQQDINTPIILMGYLNPVEKMGYEQFANAASEAGVDGVLTVDLPPEESDEFVSHMKANQLDCIFLIAPTTIESRIRKIAEYGSGFLYYVSLKGVTGSSILNVDEVDKKLQLIRSITDLPLAVGFGIKDKASASAVGKVADAVVVGSAIVKKVEANKKDTEKILHDIGELLFDMREGMDQ